MFDRPVVERPNRNDRREDFVTAVADPGSPGRTTTADHADHADERG
jgi:hypothetical protein